MSNFLNTLFSNENFPIYLGIIIVILVIAFCVVLFLGKKDQKKIEQTQKLQKISDDAFKETTEVQKVELDDKEEEKIDIEEQFIAFPKMPDEKVEDIKEESTDELIIESNNTVSENVEPEENVLLTEESSEDELYDYLLEEKEENSDETLDLLDIELPHFDVLDEKEDIVNYSELESSLERELNEVEYLKNNNSDIIVPASEIKAIIDDIKEEPLFIEDKEEFEGTHNNVFEEVNETAHEDIISPVVEEVKPQTKTLNIFSSVYVPEKKQEDVTHDAIKEVTIDPVVIEESNESIKEIEVPEFDEFNEFEDFDSEIELPKLK